MHVHYCNSTWHYNSLFSLDFFSEARHVFASRLIDPARFCAHFRFKRAWNKTERDIISKTYTQVYDI